MKEKIDRFMACNKFAVAGVSRNRNKFGSMVFRELKKKGYDIVPVNPGMDTFEGEKCFRSVSDLPSGIQALIVVTRQDACMIAVKEALEKGINNIFIQQGAQIRKVVEYAKNYGNANVICRHCILMFAKPSGIHKFHERIARLFRFYPS
jgi:uncharacterized protein